MGAASKDKESAQAIAYLTATMHHDVSAQELHEDRYYYGNQHPPPSEQQQQQQRPPQEEDDDEKEQQRQSKKPVLQPGKVVQATVQRIESYGAFCQFGLLEEEEEGPQQQQQYQGFIHASEMGTTTAHHKTRKEDDHPLADAVVVDKVEDRLNLQEKVYAVILEVPSSSTNIGGEKEKEDDGSTSQKIIRLSLTGVDQDTGKVTHPATLLLGSSSSSESGHLQGGNYYRSFLFLRDRAQQRRKIFQDMVQRHAGLLVSEEEGDSTQRRHQDGLPPSSSSSSDDSSSSSSSSSSDSSNSDRKKNTKDSSSNQSNNNSNDEHRKRKRALDPDGPQQTPSLEEEKAGMEHHHTVVSPYCDYPAATRPRVHFAVPMATTF
jgi:hypothetical protein